MEISITGRNCDLNESIRRYIQKKVGKLDRSFPFVTRADVVLEERKEDRIVEIIFHMKGHSVIAKETSIDMYAAVDQAHDSLRKQLSRMTDKIHTKKRRRMVLKNFIRPMFRFGRGPEELPAGEAMILKSEAFSEKPMLPEEAKMELDMSEKTFIVFRNSDTGLVNVLYKRNDGNYGLIEPKF
ncbi:MAG TPA: ribosome-associated translation inhibitor RaiA [Candidatus Omnitrophota bacterium]|nr:ribosome-associated translation inhibitor RaiA [Candidatus Omnitrophota bacterium]HPS19854.1 ribosome-associated translation inhibitor RaiA [Candidatus Omnitrophota bacterium]